MANKLPMARKEIERWTVLLDREPDREASRVSTDRDKRTQISSTTRGLKDGSVKDTPRQSKSSRKAKGTDASSSRPKGHRRNHKDRKQDRRAEGEDTAVWRSASELGVVFPSSYCSDTNPHYWIGVENICSGTLFRCIYCRRHLWLPAGFGEATEIGNMIEKLGSDGYCKHLDKPKNRYAKIMMAKLQELERISVNITDANEMAKIAVKILDQKEYDRREAQS